ncbi:glycoside hydrolase family 3 N-terminal domain-containing protein [Arthrobacter sp. StoSoilB20]|uniref:glycoside hydrolase family 3 protein n=1 Tax=Arthrobacter sp. StoSoilB20 TaxID=2830995 RepID=UPI001CC3B119|nr:glycoside hydrolase family 3 N-terminal domain-containing protein [Arthrobacter sp. StoSoilB20]BCW57062.1 beta-glucosidase [Arthrobacter sp. StoSoilB20]
MRRSVSTTEDGVQYRDLNGNGVLDPYEDPRLDAATRAADLLSRLSVEEKVGLLFNTVMVVGEPGDHDAASPFGPETPRDFVVGRSINHFNVGHFPSAEHMARWQNAMQELAELTPHGIPITFGTDPRHGFAQNDGMAFAAGSFSQWPEPMGLAALGDAAVVSDFAQTARSEYVAVGLRAALHPQLDLASDPRWARQLQSFSSIPAVASEYGALLIAGLQGQKLSSTSVACTAKHFPGGGAQEDGEDPHFPSGKAQVYPGGNFEEHLAPFREAIAAGTSAIMPYYSLAKDLVIDGTEVEEVGFSYNKYLITSLLRGQLGFEGVILTDWQLVTDLEVFGLPFPAKAWGVEHLSPLERVERLFDAGVDQLGGESCTELVLELLADGRLSPERVDASVLRILQVKFELGLFDNPYVDVDAVSAVVGSAPFRDAGHRAQAESVTILKNDGLLPLPADTRVYVEGINPDVVGDRVTLVDDAKDADMALVRLTVPYEPRNEYFLDAMTHQGSLDFPEEDIARVRALAEELPVILDVYLERAGILTPFVDIASAITANFGASDAALFDALTGAIPPKGRLPIELPRSMAAVEASHPDVPNDTEDPLYPYGAGLSLPSTARSESGMHT